MPLTPEDVQNKRFTTVRFKTGYDEEEVDAFLDEVEAELRRLLAENESFAKAPAPSAAEPIETEEPNEAALRTLLLAQRTADDAIAQAKAEAEQLVAAAKARASTIETEAQQQHAAAMAELTRQRAVLEAQVEELRAFEREYRGRLKGYLEGQLRELDTKGATPPVPGAAAARPAAPAAPPGAGPRPAAPPPPVGPPAGGPPPAGQPPGGPPPAVPPPPPPPTAASVRPPTPTVATPGAAPRSPFTPAPPLVEDVDSGSDTPTRPPREAGEEDTDSG